MTTEQRVTLAPAYRDPKDLHGGQVWARSAVMNWDKLGREEPGYELICPAFDDVDAWSDEDLRAFLEDRTDADPDWSRERQAEEARQRGKRRAAR
jgi:hypothetical protein